MSRGEIGARRQKGIKNVSPIKPDGINFYKKISFARMIQQSGFPNVKVSNYKVVNVLGNCRVPFALDIMQFSVVRESKKKEEMLK